jgi:hypothetical protein
MLGERVYCIVRCHEAFAPLWRKLPLTTLMSEESPAQPEVVERPLIGTSGLRA